jgi:hypothetical protein
MGFSAHFLVHARVWAQPHQQGVMAAAGGWADDAGEGEAIYEEGDGAYGRGDDDTGEGDGLDDQYGAALDEGEELNYGGAARDDDAEDDSLGHERLWDPDADLAFDANELIDGGDEDEVTDKPACFSWADVAKRARGALDHPMFPTKQQSKSGGRGPRTQRKEVLDFVVSKRAGELDESARRSSVYGSAVFSAQLNTDGDTGAHGALCAPKSCVQQRALKYCAAHVHP